MGAASAAVMASSACTSGSAPVAGMRAATVSGLERARTKVTLLGTGGGPVYWPGKRHGISTALTVGDATYLIDLGQGFAEQYRQSGLAGNSITGLFGNLRAVFISHLHLDHIADLGPLLTWGQANGVKPARPVRIIGPSATAAAPGMIGTVDLMTKAFGASLANTGIAPHRLFRTSDLTLPAAAKGGAQVHGVTPWVVYEDDRVRVSTTVVSHGTMRPAHAFRFETPDGVITFSGDTAPCENLDRMAADSSIYVHEAFDPDALLPIMGSMAAVDAASPAHTTVAQLAGVGNAANAPTMLLTHLGPGTTGVDWARGGKGFKGRLIPGEDLMTVGLNSGKLLT